MKSLCATVRKTSLHAVLAGSVFLGGCSFPYAMRQQQIDRVLSMNRAGQLTDEQTIQLISVINGSPATGTSAAHKDMLPAKPSVSPPAAARSAVEAAAAPGAPAAAPVVPETPSVPAASAMADVQVRVAYPVDTYAPRTVLSGRLRSVGSDTMDRIMGMWEIAFREYHPNIRFYHEGKGSGTAPPALAEGRSDFGPMSRKPKAGEIEQFRSRFGYEPTVCRVAVDSVGVFVHPLNPIARQGLDFTRLDSVFSSTRHRGGADITTWGQLGIGGEWADAPIHVYSRNSASGTYAFFREHVLLKGDYRVTNTELAGSEPLVEAIAADRFGIGYSGIGYKTNRVAVVPIAEKAGGRMFTPEARYAYSGEYPLARFLYLTLNHAPGTKPSDLHREFLTFVYSSIGQALVEEDGFFRVSAEIANEDLGFVLGE